MLEGKGLVLRQSKTLIRMLTFILVCHLLQFFDRLLEYLSPDGRRSNVVYRATAQK